MKNSGKETICYTIEREFLAKVTVEELINRMIRAHIKEQSEKEAAFL